jgi:hypothetical protein
MAKAKTTEVAMVRVPVEYEGLVLYAERDGNVLNARSSFIAQVPVRGRSLPQNSLWGVWYPKIGKAVGQTAEEVKRECKLLYGVPILCADDEGFRRMWFAKFDNDNYVQQLFLMRYLPVTSLMSKAQGSIYTETLQREYAKRQIILYNNGRQHY